MRKINLKTFNVATSLTAREINRRIILNVIRTRQPISRADLARQTGLQRSTVSLIADQLIQEGWIKEGAFGRLPRGRRPIHLHLNTEVQRILAVDLRPTITSMAVSDLYGEYIARKEFETDADPKKFLATLTEAAKEMIRENPGVFQGVGISVPGRVDRANRRLIFAPNLGWRNIDIKTPIEKALEIPVSLENAANACALSEIYFGKDTDEIENLIAVTVSEGIGAGVVVNGQLMRGPRGTAGEFGHVSVDPDGPVCACGNRGCWEMYASNKAAQRYWAEAKGVSSSKLNFESLLEALDRGDPLAVQTLEKTGTHLGLGLAMLVSGFTPTVIVVVGEITRAWKTVGPAIKKTVMERSIEAAETRIVPTDETQHPRLRGAVALVMETHFGAPSVA